MRFSSVALENFVSGLGGSPGEGVSATTEECLVFCQFLVLETHLGVQELVLFGIQGDGLHVVVVAEANVCQQSQRGASPFDFRLLVFLEWLDRVVVLYAESLMEFEEG